MIRDLPVTLFVQSSPNGCNFYRLAQNYRKIAELDALPVASNTDLSAEDYATWLDKSDLIVTQCYVTEKFCDYMVEEGDRMKFVIDMDDNIFEVSPFNPSYERNGTREVDIELPDGTKFEIRNGKKGFYSEKPIDLQDNRRRVTLAGQCLKMADVVTTPSPVLGGVFKRLNKNVKVVKNVLDFTMWKPLPMKKDDTIRIGWQGGWSHYMDFFEVKETLERLMEKHKNVVLVISGQAFPGIFEKMPKERLEFHPWVTIDVYPWMFKTLNLDIGIAPIENNIFNTCKSEIKWEEYSSLEIPCVASDIPPYSLNIEDGKTGFLAKSPAEWEKALTDLIESKELRERVGKAARAKVVEDYDINKVIHKNIEIYKGLFKPELIIV